MPKHSSNHARPVGGGNESDMHMHYSSTECFASTKNILKTETKLLHFHLEVYKRGLNELLDHL